MTSVDVTAPTRSYVPSERWSLFDEGEFLLVSAGADELYTIESAAPDAGDELVAAWRSALIDRESLSAGARELLDQLVAAGIVRPELPEVSPWTVAFRLVGDRCGELERALADALEAGVALDQAELEDSDFVVFVRTTGRLADLYAEAPDWRQRPHLLLDAAYDHTVSLGPLVFAGDTACLGCLAGRIGHYWGDAPPPPKPAVQRHATLVASLLALEIEKIATGDYGLVNTTVSWDLRGREVTRSAVYKLPWCPFCGEPAAAAEPIGSIDLPWTRAA